MSSDLQRIATDMLRLTNFLACNQLVQANAVAQRIEGVMEDAIKRDPVPPEKHRYWKMFKHILRAKQIILSGNTKAASEEISQANALLMGIEQ